MEHERNMMKVKIIETNENQTLFECSVEDIEFAYQKAKEYEAMGLEVKLISPTISQSLTYALGLNHDEQEEYEQSVIAEIDDHDGSCCHDNSSNKSM